MRGLGNRGLGSLSDGPAYAGQQKIRLRLPSIPGLLATTITTGVIANSYELSTANIVSFAARFGSTFDEYRILGADVAITPVTASVGVSVHLFDEKSTAAPTQADSQERIGLRLANTNANAKSKTTMRWRARDLLDLEYTAIGTTTTPCTFKTYTDLAVWGAPVAVTNLWLVEPTLIVEFRGIKSI